MTEWSEYPTHREYVTAVRRCGRCARLAGSVLVFRLPGEGVLYDEDAIAGRIVYGRHTEAHDGDPFARLPVGWAVYHFRGDPVILVIDEAGLHELYRKLDARRVLFLPLWFDDKAGEWAPNGGWAQYEIVA